MKTLVTAVRLCLVAAVLSVAAPAQFFYITTPLLFSWEISAPAAIVVDASDGRILWGKAAHQRRANASTTKMVTALVARDFSRLPLGHPARRSLGSTVSVGWKPPLLNVGGGGSANLQYGERLTLHDALRFLMLPSANDAAVAIAEHCAFTELQFVSLMNQKVAQLGLTDTFFVTAHGAEIWPITNAHYSSAYDLAQIGRRVLADPVLAAIVGAGSLSVKTSRQGNVTIYDTNKFVLYQSYSGIVGIKTGTTPSAGRCLVSAATRSGRTVISVVLGASSDAARYADARRLMDHGFACLGL